MIPFRSHLIKDELRDNKNGAVHIFLCLKEKMKVVLFSMDEMPDKTFWINQKNKGGGPLLNGPFIKSGLVRVRKATLPEYSGELSYQNLYKV